MTNVKSVRIDGNGIAWSGPFTSVVLAGHLTQGNGKALEANFRALVGTGEKINFFVDFPEDDNGKQETWEGTGIVEDYDDTGEEAKVFLKLDRNVTMHIRRPSSLSRRF
jgi:hypothetical protein